MTGTVLTARVNKSVGDPPADLAARALFIVGADDQHTTLSESEQLFAAAAEPKELWIVEGGKHVDLHALKKEEYERRVLTFFKGHLSPK